MNQRSLTRWPLLSSAFSEIVDRENQLCTRCCLRIRSFSVSFAARNEIAQPLADVITERPRITSAHGELATGDAATTSSPPRTATPPPPRLAVPFPFPFSGVLSASPQPHGRESHTTTTLHPYPTLSLAIQPPPFSSLASPLPSVGSSRSPAELPSSQSFDDPHRSLAPQRPSSSASTPLGPSFPVPHCGRFSLFIFVLGSRSLARFCFSRPGALVGVPPRPSTLPTRFGAVAAAAAVR